MPIRQLAPEVAAKIAAGEVVERPASVVKELIENSIDAGASQIRVDLIRGGLQLIRVSDNGCGIPAEELPLALARHATSKVSTVEDLESIRSLGFRGEALASIAAVAEVVLISRPRGAAQSAQVSACNGQISAVSSAASPEGTIVTVRNLFSAVPARLKFLKSRQTEVSHCLHLLQQYALAYPEIRFTVTSEGREVFTTPGDGQLATVLVQMYGPAVARQMVPLGGQPADDPERPVISGYVSRPACYKSTRQYLSFFVNRRWVHSRLLIAAVEEAYRTLLLSGRHPLAVINIQVDPSQIDVNVHPAKTEIRFLRERRIYAELMRAVRRAVLEEAEAPSWQPAQRPASSAAASTDVVLASPEPESSPQSLEEEAVTEERAAALVPDATAQEQSREGRASTPLAGPAPRKGPESGSSLGLRHAFPLDNPWLTVSEEERGERAALQSRLWQSHLRPQQGEPARGRRALTAVPAGSAEPAKSGTEAEQEPAASAGEEAPSLAAPLAPEEVLVAAQPGPRQEHSRFPELRVIGQLLQSYIVAEGRDGLYLIDQHAAHERIVLERMLAARQEQTSLAQILLTPLRLDLSPAELEAIEERLDDLRSLGFELEVLDHGQVLARAVPSVLAKQLSARSLQELLRELTAPEHDGYSQTWEEHALANIACKAAIKANYFLTSSEMRELIDQLARTRAPFSCCHGRPTTIHFSAAALEREFGRR
ncbi:MAG: DNA mismatch repair endonuclease MutL [Thermogemmatispora sp.]|uniref:DNA mismatch repair endonuclease MutL n=1 Tax=Thermogemmatispora sp. TaxID=1968838 RepID=UPI00263158B2|nr:DNA mismatch repair endonuclease MutL [Thermogemmatispora sp.]MBX5455599.1 DNA mismatch repair endonuclease MutL [Thermogemmatispora sp.]